MICWLGSIRPADEIASVTGLSGTHNYKGRAMGLEGCAVEEIVASASLTMIGQAAFRAAVEQLSPISTDTEAGRRVILKWPQ